MITITQNYMTILTYNFHINIHLHAYNFSNYRMEDVIMDMISWIKYKKFKHYDI